jgi:hypothetical protein
MGRAKVNRKPRVSTAVVDGAWNRKLMDGPKKGGAYDGLTYVDSFREHPGWRHGARITR